MRLAFFTDQYLQAAVLRIHPAQIHDIGLPVHPDEINVPVRLEKTAEPRHHYPLVRIGICFYTPDGLLFRIHHIDVILRHMLVPWKCVLIGFDRRTRSGKTVYQGHGPYFPFVFPDEEKFMGRAYPCTYRGIPDIGFFPRISSDGERKILLPVVCEPETVPPAV